MMAKASKYEWITWIIVTIGGLNWGLVGFFDYNLVSALFGSAATIVYDIVGLASLYGAWLMVKYSKQRK
jgi:uncharacterized membrane protein YuzA (DUF378 family)